MNERLNVWQEQLPYGLWLVGVRGRLDQALTPQLDETLSRLLGNGRYRLIVNLSEITYINSGGLRCLVSAWRKARNNRGDVVLVGLNERIQEIFTMVGFDKVFHIYGTSLEAQTALRTASS